MSESHVYHVASVHISALVVPSPIYLERFVLLAFAYGLSCAVQIPGGPQQAEAFPKHRIRPNPETEQGTLGATGRAVDPTDDGPSMFDSMYDTLAQLGYVDTQVTLSFLASTNL